MTSQRSLREHLRDSFNDEELRDICFDHFRPVYERLTVGMTKSQIVQLLLDHCTRHAEGERLLDVIEAAHPGRIGAERPRLLAQLYGGRTPPVVAPPVVTPPPVVAPPPGAPATADLEISLYRLAAGRYSAEARFTHPRSSAAVETSLPAGTALTFDQDDLQRHALNPRAYGQALSACLFAAPALRSIFVQADSVAQALGAPLRLRLRISSGAAELHNLRWETLRHPEHGEALLTSQPIYFSRYLSSADWAPVQLPAPGALRALVAVANPTNLDDYHLPALEVPAAVAQIQQSLGGIATTVLAGPGSATLDAIGERLREGYEMLYLMAHGQLVKGETWLWLENRAGMAEVIAGSALITRVRELSRRPLLAVLAACQSGGRGAAAPGSADILALGPRLVEAGVPAVIAMNGAISSETVTTLMARFCTELQRDGQVDRAMAEARAAVRDRADWWRPVLFLRLPHGRIWQ